MFIPWGSRVRLSPEKLELPKARMAGAAHAAQETRPALYWVASKLIKPLDSRRFRASPRRLTTTSARTLLSMMGLTETGQGTLGSSLEKAREKTHMFRTVEEYCSGYAMRI